MLMFCDFERDSENAARYRCTRCGIPSARNIQYGRDAPIQRHCPGPPPDLTPLLTRLANLTNHPEIVDQPQAYGRAAQQWAAGLIIRTPDGREADQIEPFEIRDNDEVAECLELCRANVCKKHDKGICKPSCGPGMIVEVKARMATESCPWTGKGGQGPRW